MKVNLPEHYSPYIQAKFTGGPTQPRDEKNAYNYFQNYRNEKFCRMQLISDEWLESKVPYIPKPAVMSKSNEMDKFLKMPESQFTMLDKGRQREIDDFYMMCQYHRDQYKDMTGCMHPSDYFKSAEFKYQCPKDPTTVYLQYPQYYLRYKTPQVFPLTLDRTHKIPLLPGRSLAGRYEPNSMSTFQRSS